MSNTWLRLYKEFAHDPKVQTMSEAMQRRLIMLFCLRCGNADATLHATDEIAFWMRISDAELVETKALFLQKGFIEEDWSIKNWDKRQVRSDSSTERSRKHRADKNKVTKRPCNVAATEMQRPVDTEQIQNREEESKKNIIKKVSRRLPKVSLQTWEKNYGPISSEQLLDFAREKSWSEQTLAENITLFRRKCEIKNYDYTNFIKAFMTWTWEEKPKNNEVNNGKSQQARNSIARGLAMLAGEPQGTGAVGRADSPVLRHAEDVRKDDGSTSEHGSDFCNGIGEISLSKSEGGIHEIHGK